MKPLRRVRWPPLRNPRTAPSRCCSRSTSFRATCSAATRAFAADAAARDVARRAIASGFDLRFQNPERRFFYLPFMHSETLADQERCAELCRRAGDLEGVAFAEIHADIIRRFGRFPHRNAVLGRATTPQEQAFLDDGGFAR